MQSADRQILEMASATAEKLLHAEDLTQGTQHCLKLSAELIQKGRLLPDLLLAIAFLEQDKTTYSTALPARQACLFAFFGLRLQFNDHYLQHLIAGAFASSTLILLAPEKLSIYRKAWQVGGLDLFISLARVAKSVQTENPERYLQEHKLDNSQIWQLIVLSVLRSKAVVFSAKLKPAIQRLSSLFHGNFNAMLVYPGNMLPGDAVSLPSGNGYYLYRLSFDTAAVWYAESGQIEEVHCQRMASTNQAPLTLSRWATLSTRVFPILKPIVKQLIPQQHPVSRPPAELKTIISGLQDADADIPRMASRIENIPLFAAYLKNTASSDNRLQLAVRDVKHAMLTYGMTRVADMLILRALSQRLHQRYYPLLAMSIRFSDVTASLAAELADHCNSKETPQTLSLLATFVTAPLFTEAALKTRTQWPAGGGNLFDLSSLWQKKGASLSEMSTTLARQWQQLPRYQAVISHCSSRPADVPSSLRCDASILGLSVSITRQWLFTETMNETTRQYQQQVFALLNLSPASLETIRTRLAKQLWLPLNSRP